MAHKRREAKHWMASGKAELIADLTSAAPWYEAFEFALCFAMSCAQGFYPEPQSPACQGIGIVLALLNCIPFVIFVAYGRTFRHFVLNFYAKASGFVVTVQGVFILVSMLGAQLGEMEMALDTTDAVRSLLDLIRSAFDFVTVFVDSQAFGRALANRVRHTLFHGRQQQELGDSAEESELSGAHSMSRLIDDDETTSDEARVRALGLGTAAASAPSAGVRSRHVAPLSWSVFGDGGLGDERVDRRRRVIFAAVHNEHGV
jgi:hypothetical protein